MRRGRGGAAHLLGRAMCSTSFRVSTAYAALVLILLVVLFQAVAWSVTRVARRQIDSDVREETQEVLLAARARSLPALERTVRDYLSNAPDAYYLVQTDRGQRLVGNLSGVAPTAGWHFVHDDGRLIRVFVQAVPGGTLAVGVDDIESSRLGRAISHAFLLGLGATVLLALGGGLMTSLLVLRRIEAVSRASRAIMAGDFSRRIPLRGSDDEFDHLATVLNQMLDRIQALMANVQQVTSDIAHDLRTPLTRLRQRLELVAERPSSAGMLRSAVSASVGEVDAILSTFSALLRISQIEAGSRRSGFAPVDLPALTAELLEVYQPVAEETGRRLLPVQGAAGPAAPVQGDRPLLAQLLSNLLENAIRHTPPGSTIAAQAQWVEGAWALVVADDGPGIPPAQRVAVLTRFTRLEASRSRPGNGLGLALVAAIAGLHGARLVLEDNLPGLRVVVWFASA